MKSLIVNELLLTKYCLLFPDMAFLFFFGWTFGTEGSVYRSRPALGTLIHSTSADTSQPSCPLLYSRLWSVLSFVDCTRVEKSKHVHDTIFIQFSKY